MATTRSVRWTAFVVIGSMLVATVNAANNTNTTGTIDQLAVQLSNETAFGVCLYPASGTYSSLNRLLYYCTLIFSLFSRAHLWLVAGALASALTYAGAAAVHACLLAWRGPNPYEESDSWPLTTILGVACLITVPLLNWSGTLRRLGATFANKRDKNALKTQSSAGTRTIVIYWGFLVLVGYLSIWKASYSSSSDAQYPDMGQVFCRPGTNASVFHSADGTFHKRAIDQDFVTANKCNNPCDTITVPSIFRQNSDLVLIDHKKALLYDGTLTGAKYKKLYQFVDKQDSFDVINQFIVAIVLLQGFVTACFGRRDPREIRDLIYIKLAMDHSVSDKPVLIATQDWFARILAFLSYLMAVLMIVVCPPLFIMIIVEQEWSTRHEYPDAEPMSSVGQWGPWAVAVQVILAALISKYHDKVVESIAKGCRRVNNLCRGRAKKQRYQDVRQQKQEPNQIDLEATDVENATVTTKSIEPIEPTTKPTTPTPIDKPPTQKPWFRSLGSTLYKCYTTCASPINQNGKGLLDELQNFIAWCKSPAATSERVVRHPIRPVDKEMKVDVDHTYDEKGNVIEISHARRESGFFRAATVKKPHEKPLRTVVTT